MSAKDQERRGCVDDLVVREFQPKASAREVLRGGVPSLPGPTADVVVMAEQCALRDGEQLIGSDGGAGRSTAHFIACSGSRDPGPGDCAGMHEVSCELPLQSKPTGGQRSEIHRCP